MRRLTFAIILGALLCSCTKDNGYAYRSDVLSGLSNSLYRYIVCNPVQIMNDEDRSSGDRIFEDDYHCEKDYAGGKVTVNKAAGLDSTWIVSGNYQRTIYSSQVIMTGRDSIGLCLWKCTGKGAYDEGDGYTLNLWTDDAASFTWASTVSSSQVCYRLQCNIEYTYETFKDGKLIKQYKNSYSGTVY